MKEVLSDLGIIVANPKDTYKQAFLNDFITDEAKWLKMIEDRIYLVHCYSSEDSRKIFGQVQEIYLSILSAFFEKIKQKSG